MKKFTKVVPYRRKKQGKTDYKKRLKMLVSGTPRLVVRKTNKNMIVQLVDYNADGDKVLITSTSAELKKLGWNHATGNLPASYLTGYLTGKKAVKRNLTNAIVDLGLQNSLKGTRLFAAVKGAIDAGMNIPCSDTAIPPADRLSGKHISNYGKSKDATSIEKDFSALKSKIN